MRNAFAKEMEVLARQDERIVLLSGDIGNRMFNDFKSAYPDRFYNCGIAEANMTSVAAGLALAGMRPVTYTIAAFNTLRCLEQIRLDVCYQNLPVILVGVGAGLAYASLNATHHALEDVGCLRLLPNLAVVCPGDAMEVRAAMRAAIAWNGPVYIRLGKKNEPLVHKEVPKEFRIGEALTVRSGVDACLLSTGTTLPLALDVADSLREHGLALEVVSFHTVKPLDADFLQAAVGRFPVLITLEEHTRCGGLGGAVAEWLADHPSTTPRLIRYGTADRFLYEAGERDHALSAFGLTADRIATELIDYLHED